MITPVLPFARDQPLRRSAETLLMVAGVTAAGLAAAPVVPEAAIDLAYLVPVLAAASLHGLRFGILASVASALAYNFFFTAPLHTLRIDDPGNVVTVLILLGVALFTSRMTARIREEAESAAASARQNAILAGFTGQLVTASGGTSIGRVLCAELAGLYGANTVFLGPGNPPELLAAVPERPAPDGVDREAAAAAASSGHPAGRHTATLQAADWQFHPLRTSGVVLGVIGLARDDGRVVVTDADQGLLNSMLAQAALALEREQLAAEMRDVTQLRDRDRLRGALLSSVGHDLRTPLTAIFAGIAELPRTGAAAPLTATLNSAAHQLDRYIGNLLEMTRIEAGAIRLKLEAVDLTDAVAAAVRALQPTLTGLRLQVDVAADLPLVQLDPQLLHHILINLIDNAAKHGGPEGRIVIGAVAAGGGLVLSVRDAGPGLPAGSETRIFDTFARLEGSDRSHGTGLGLSIVKGFAEAMGAAVSAYNHAEGGAVFELRFPPAMLITTDGAA